MGGGNILLLKDIPLKNKIKCGKFYFPSNEADLICAKSVRKLVTKAVDLDEFLGEAGSVTLVEVNGKKLAFFTLHQLNLTNKFIDRELLENVLIPSLSTGEFRNIPMNSLHHCLDENDEEYLDIIALEADDSFDVVKKESCYFYPLQNYGNKKVHQYFYVGYPILEDNIQLNSYGGTTEIRNRGSIRSCYFDPNFQSAAKHFQRFTLDPSDYPMNGISGGAVFALIENSMNDFEVVLKGIITRANENFLHIIDSEFISLMAESF